MGWRLVIRQGVDLAYIILVAVGAFKPSRRLRPRGIYKASGDPPLLERPFPLAQFVCYFLFSLSESTYSLL
jgi:hypothetical protein